MSNLDDFLALETTDIFFGDLTPNPKKIKDWDPKSSASVTEAIYKKWNKLTEELLSEIFLAYLALKDKDNTYKISFSDWCKQAGLPSATVVRKWIIRYIDPEKYEVIAEKDKTASAESAITRTIDPIVDQMEITMTKDGVNSIEVEIEIFGKKFKKKIAKIK